VYFEVLFIGLLLCKLNFTWIKYLAILLIETESLLVRGIALCEDSIIEGLLLVFFFYNGFFI